MALSGVEPVEWYGAYLSVLLELGVLLGFSVLVHLLHSRQPTALFLGLASDLRPLIRLLLNLRVLLPPRSE